MIDHRLPRLVAAFLACAVVAATAQESGSEADSLRRRQVSIGRAAAYTSAYYATSLIVLGRTWYRDKDVVRFHFYDDTRGYLQVDKAGHAFGSYVYSHAGFRFLAARGYSRKQALLFGGSLGLVLQTPVEIMDGIHEGYGFSWGDMAANAAGSAFVVGQELLFGGQTAVQKFSYRPSMYAGRANGLLGSSALDRLFTDYNGHTYWLSLPIRTVWSGSGALPWMNVAVGYGGNGMYGEFANLPAYEGATLPQATRYRQFLLSLDVDWRRMDARSPLARGALRALTFAKLPFPAVEYDSRGRWTAHWLYF